MRCTVRNNKRPSDRVRDIMNRISRNRFIHPKDVHLIATKLSIRSVRGAGCWGNVIKAAINPGCEYVGMINGKPPFCRITELAAYTEWGQWLRDYRHSGKINYELQLLRVKRKYHENNR